MHKPVEIKGEYDSNDVKITLRCYIQMVKTTVKTCKVFKVVS